MRRHQTVLSLLWEAHKQSRYHERRAVLATLHPSKTLRYRVLANSFRGLIDPNILTHTLATLVVDDLIDTDPKPDEIENMGQDFRATLTKKGMEVAGEIDLVEELNRFKKERSGVSECSQST